MLSVSVLTNNLDSWFLPFARELIEKLSTFADARFVQHHTDVPRGDIAYYLSYEAIVPLATLQRNHHNIVVHASDLPQGRGMSPITWQILEGKNTIPITLFEAVPKLDAGPIYLRHTLALAGHELLPDIQARLGQAIVDMCLEFAQTYPEVLRNAKPQVGTPSYYRRRTPKDSELDPHKTIADQFNLLRIVDNDKYPAYFHHRGRRYRLTIEPEDDP